MIYGYARVSTQKQARLGTSLEDQQKILKENGAQDIYADVYTGTKLDRPQFEKLRRKIKKGDTLMVTKLDRLSRSVSDGITIIDGLLDEGVKVHILNMGMMDSTSTGKLIRNILLSFAEFERDMIVERTMEGKAAARACNPDYKEGRKPLELDESRMEELKESFESGRITVKEACQEAGISRSSWYKYWRENKKRAFA